MMSTQEVSLLCLIAMIPIGYLMIRWAAKFQREWLDPPKTRRWTYVAPKQESAELEELREEVRRLRELIDDM